MRIVFMGTPEFAIPSLDILLKNKFEVVAVITSTDKMGGRNRNKLIESAVKKFAIQKNLRILQPKNLKAPDFIDELRSLNADLQIVVAFRMLPEIVWNMPSKGTYNLHGSLLPKYRGAAPINWAIINGEKETGVTSFKLKHEIDTGDILFQETIGIRPDETAGQLHDRMKEVAAQVVLRSVKAIQKGKVELKNQNTAEVSKAPKLYREDGEILWNDSTRNIYNKIRGLSPFPTAWTRLDGKTLKLFKVKPLPLTSDQPAGTILRDHLDFLGFVTRDGIISCEEVQYEGKRRMDIKSFLNGFNMKSNYNSK
jgi:methionyl-tRNA formyltransferase